MNRLMAWLWPTIVDRASAKRAAMQGYWAAFFLSIVFFVAGFLAAYTPLQPGQADHRWDILDAVVFMIIGVMIKSGSKRFAIAGLALCVFELLARLSWPLMPIWLLLVLFFLNSVRGTDGMRHFPEPEAAPEAEKPAETSQKSPD